MTDSLNSPITTAAIAWWETRRPAQWDLQMHLKYPTVRLTTLKEKDLGCAIATFIEQSLTPAKELSNDEQPQPL